MTTIRLPALKSKDTAAVSKPSSPSSFASHASHLKFLSSLTFLSLILVFSVDAARIVDRIEYREAPGTKVVLKSVFETVPASGFAPILVEIVNSTDRDRQWRIHSSSQDPFGNLILESSFRLPCKASSSAVHSILVPIAASDEGYGQSIRFTISEPSLGRQSASFQTSSNNQWPSIAISENLSDAHLKAFTDEVDRVLRARGGTPHFGHTFTPSELFSDWRALSGFDALMITVAEWENLPPPPKKAILEWNRLGGNILLYPTSSPNDSQPVRLDDNTKLVPGQQLYRSLGKVQLHKNEALDVEEIIGAFRKYVPKTHHFDTDYRAGWGVLYDFGTRSFNSWIVFLVLVAFGIAVGPVNFWILAKPGQRHRLFVTTPLLSIGASILLGLIILISDGIGGKGLRFVAINLEPTSGERRAYITQEQLARTGLLIRTGFEVEDNTMLTPLRLEATRWSHFDTNRSRSNELEIHGRQMAGEWFRSRSESAHLVQAARPTRARIELLSKGSDNDKPPKLFSSLGFDADELYYVDDDGEFWRSASPVKTGRPVILEACTRSDADKWWSEESSHASRNLADRLQLILDRGKNTFLVSTKDSRANPIDAGDFVRWSNSRILVFGSPLSVDEPPSPEPGVTPASTARTSLELPDPAS
ncbi:MAG: hypothetical protein AAF591_01090 [Verrucomicrobiota bacterium]